MVLQGPLSPFHNLTPTLLEGATKVAGDNHGRECCSDVSPSVHQDRPARQDESPCPIAALVITDRIKF